MNSTKILEVKKEIEALQSKNIGIFIDFDNMYYTLKDYGVDFEDDKECIFTLIQQLYNRDSVRTLRAYADFDQVKVSLTRLQNKRVQIRHVYGNGKDEQNRKNASDIELSIDAIEMYYRDSDIDTFVFFTSDSDMIPIMSRLIFKGKKVHFYYVNGHVSQTQDLNNYCHLSANLLDLLEIDPVRGTPEYWESSIVSAITQWYNDSKNASYNLGGGFLNNLIVKTTGVTPKRADELIEHLKEKAIIYKEIIGKNTLFKLTENTQKK